VVNRLLLALLLLLGTAGARAETALIAVAANFSTPAERLIQTFTAETGHQIEVSTGSTGTLAAQIRNGAPFMLFLSADEQRPAELESEGLAVAGSPMRSASWCCGGPTRSGSCSTRRPR
jgi:molybdate transport system substrate-binding protein